MSKLFGFSLNTSLVGNVCKYADGLSLKELIGNITYDWAEEYLNSNPVNKSFANQRYSVYNVYFDLSEKMDLVKDVSRNLTPGIGLDKSYGRVSNMALRDFIINARKVGAKDYFDYKEKMEERI